MKKEFTKCKLPIWFAYLMLIYISACVYYVIFTRNIGTPFNNSLFDYQIQIKNDSADQRRNIFYTGIVVSTVLFLIWRPFKACK